MKSAVGKPKAEIDSPALVVDLNILSRNIEKMAAFFRDKPAVLRPHFKTPKTVEIARMQLKAGACGITCAKLGEAEVLVENGITDVLIANEVVGRDKVLKLVEMNRTAGVMCAVDDAEQAERISTQALAAGVTVGVLVDVDVGLSRCGVHAQTAVDLARIVHKLRGLELRGIMGYEGHSVFIRDRDERKIAAEKSMSILVEAAQRIRESGLPCPVVSAGGTGTYDITGSFSGVTEVQAGSYCLMDVRYDGLDLGFEKAAVILSSVCSKAPAVPGLIILDAGLKVMSNEFGMPEPVNFPGASLIALSEEHGHLSGNEQTLDVKIGEKIELYPSHICTTVNLHDVMYVTSGDTVVDVWPIRGRGKSR